MKKHLVNLSIGLFIGLLVFFSDYVASTVISITNVFGQISLGVFSYFLAALTIFSPLFLLLSYITPRISKNGIEHPLREKFFTYLAGFVIAYFLFLLIAVIASSQFSISL